LSAMYSSPALAMSASLRTGTPNAFASILFNRSCLAHFGSGPVPTLHRFPPELTILAPAQMLPALAAAI
jgi:hypothetical protein